MKHLDVSNNGLSCQSVVKSIAFSFPNVQSICLDNNQFHDVQELTPLMGLKFLKNLSIQNNPATIGQEQSTASYVLYVMSGAGGYYRAVIVAVWWVIVIIDVAVRWW